MRMTKYDKLHAQLLEAYNQQLIRTLFYSRCANDTFTEYKIVLHPHTQRTTLLALADCLRISYQCRVEYDPFEHALRVSSYNTHKITQDMRHP